ncbi:hypothetical protein [Klebsiella grimontii]|uniref:hypothetical protein n=1 Tax=Klebsiella grimontii TaxID=2058152 RepID=UPI000DD3ACD8|nr:hypothetical protein [Klebsiella grimontii]
MTITLQAVNELIQSLENAGELSIKETKVMALAKAYQQLAAENVRLKEAIPQLKSIDYKNESIDDVTLAEQIGFNAAVMAMHRWVPETPATDRIVAGIKADGVEQYAVLFADTVNMEREHNQQFHKGTLWFAKQLREGADK